MWDRKAHGQKASINRKIYILFFVGVPEWADEAGKDSDRKNVSVHCVWCAAGGPNPRETQISRRALRNWGGEVCKKKHQGKLNFVYFFNKPRTSEVPTVKDPMKCVPSHFLCSIYSLTQCSPYIRVARFHLLIMCNTFFFVKNIFVHVSFNLNLSHMVGVRWPVNGTIHHVVLFDISLAVGKSMIRPLCLTLPNLDFVLVPIHLTVHNYVIVIIICCSSLAI